MGHQQRSALNKTPSSPSFARASLPGVVQVDARRLALVAEELDKHVGVRARALGGGGFQ
jgi:hypothetical protein